MNWLRAHVAGERLVHGHCSFVWTERQESWPTVRVYEIRDHHCERCVEDLRREGVIVDDGRAPPLRKAG